MKKIIYLLTVFITCVSCSGNDRKLEILVADKVATMSGHEVVRDLLLKNNGDQEQLARIFNCSVPTINRVKNKETKLTNNALTKFKNLLVAVSVSGEDAFKEKDPYYDSWIRSFLYWLDSIFWIALWISIPLSFVVGLGFVLDGIYIGIYVFLWILNIMIPYEQPANLFLDKINPMIEILL